MAQVQITVDEDVMRGLLTDDEGLARLVESVINELLDAQVAEQLQAQRYERSADRQGYRNGHRPPAMKARVRTLELLVNGVSTRKVKRITEELCGTSFSKSAVSDPCPQRAGGRGHQRARLPGDPGARDR